MKRLFSLVLIVILLLNTMGYYAVFIGMQYQLDLAAIEKLDANHYDVSQSVMIKLPISVPYMSDSEDFERVDGIIEHQGEHYRLVKQRYAKDTLTIVCIRDTERKKINDDISDYVKGFTDKEANQHNNNNKKKRQFHKGLLASINSHEGGYIRLGKQNSIPPFFPNLDFFF